MPRPRLRLAALACGPLLLGASPARAQPELLVSGKVLRTVPSPQVQVEVTNRGAANLPALRIVGELAGERAESRIAGGIPAGAGRAVSLDFPRFASAPGRYALVLLLEHAIAGPPDAAGNPPLASQRAAVLLALGAAPASAVRLLPRPALLWVTGRLEVAVRSADGERHRVRVRGYAPLGLRVDGDGVEVEVPARGEAVVVLPLMRTVAPRGSRRSVVVVAETRGESPVRSDVATVRVAIAPDRALLPRGRRAVLVIACLLLAVAAGTELWVRTRR